MDRLGDHLFAGAALPIDQDRRVGAARNALHDAKDIPHPFAAAEYEAVGLSVADHDRIGELRFLTDLGIGEQVPDHDEQTAGVDRFFNRVAAAELFALLGGFPLGGRRKEKNEYFAVYRADLFETFKAFHIRKIEIEENQIGREDLYFPGAMNALLHLFHDVSPAEQGGTDRPAGTLFASDNHDSELFIRHVSFLLLIVLGDVAAFRRERIRGMKHRIQKAILLGLIEGVHG